MKKSLSIAAISSIMMGCSIYVDPPEQEKPSAEEMYEVMHTYIHHDRVKEEGVESLQLISCTHDTNYCNNLSYRFIYPEKEINLGIISNTFLGVENAGYLAEIVDGEGNQVQRIPNESFPYSLSHEMVFLSPVQNNNDQLELIIEYKTEEKSYKMKEKSSKKYTMTLDKNRDTINVFKDRVILVNWI